VTAPSLTPFAYAILQVVPDIERDERLNAGVALFCRQLDYLELKVGLSEEKLRLLAPDADLTEIRGRLDEICLVVRGEPAGGPLARLEPSERFGWLVAPSSTVIRSTAAHTGLTCDPAGELNRLFDRLVA
jgi:hypothetical protein